jgi:rhamnose utilization protein RhaD (predicted bifunctional aldolase and dehydrogenase)
LGSDLRITNFGGGNTSSKLDETDPLDGQKKPVLWVKGSGGDLGSIKVEGFATLYLDKVLALARIYRGVELEDEMVGMYPLCTFGNNPVAASIDTALHAFLPFPRTGESRWLPRPMARKRWTSSITSSDTRWSGFRGSVRALNSP